MWALRYSSMFPTKQALTEHRANGILSKACHEQVFAEDSIYIADQQAIFSNLHLSVLLELGIQQNPIAQCLTAGLPLGPSAVLGMAASLSSKRETEAQKDTWECRTSHNDKVTFQISDQPFISSSDFWLPTWTTNATDVEIHCRKYWIYNTLPPSHSILFKTSHEHSCNKISRSFLCSLS